MMASSASPALSVNNNNGEPLVTATPSILDGVPTPSFSMDDDNSSPPATTFQPWWPSSPRWWGHNHPYPQSFSMMSAMTRLCTMMRWQQPLPALACPTMWWPSPVPALPNNNTSPSNDETTSPTAYWHQCATAGKYTFTSLILFSLIWSDNDDPSHDDCRQMTTATSSQSQLFPNSDSPALSNFQGDNDNHHLQDHWWSAGVLLHCTSCSLMYY